MDIVVYILYSPSFGKYYIGQTNDLDRRIEEHNKVSENSYTSKYRPWELYWSIPIESRGKAMILEKYLKKKPRTFISRLVSDDDLKQYLEARFG